jgi:hypothetical protein
LRRTTHSPRGFASDTHRLLDERSSETLPPRIACHPNLVQKHCRPTVDLFEHVCEQEAVALARQQDDIPRIGEECLVHLWTWRHAP